MTVNAVPESKRANKGQIEFMSEALLGRHPHAFHAALNGFNRIRLEPTVPSSQWQVSAQRDLAVTIAEGHFLERERSAIAAQAADAPSDPKGFVDWFESLRELGPGQYDPLFDYLAEKASYEELRWFMRQEVAGEAGFDDLVALTQIKLPEQPKLEFARNYWDEMGRGKPAGMHGPMLTRLAQALSIRDTLDNDIVWESLALANVLVGLAYNRRFAFHAIGALTAVELTAPTRATRVVEALDRLQVSKQASHYFRLHSTVDILHFQALKKEVLLPLVETTPALAVHIAEGALMRLNAGARTFDRYRAEFGITAPRAHIS